VFVHVDKDLVDLPPVNRAQEILQGVRPYFTTYSIFDVMDWEEDEQGLKWVKIRQSQEYRENPFSEPLEQIRWTIVTRESVLRYSAIARVQNGKVKAFVQESGLEIPPEEFEVPLEIAVEHGLGENPVHRLDLPSDLWVANQACLKLQEHLTLDNIKYDAANLATYVQRVYKPYKTPDSDFSETYFDDGEEDAIASGNPYILKAESFTFEEMQGTAISQVMDVLAQVEKEITDIITQGVVGSTSKGAVEQSGVSKKFDLYREEMMLRCYGKLLVEFYQDLLQTVAKSQGVPERISVKGFTKFELDFSETMIAKGKELLQLRALITPTMWRLVVKELSSALIPNASPEEEEAIAQEIKSLNPDAHFISEHG
jgi:hypothetical protein